MLYDKDIREPLFRHFEERYSKVRIIEEMTMINCRADAMMVLPDKLVGIEIKSDADNYSRLAKQIKVYDRVCDLNYVVIGSSHANHILSHVPEWWGVISVEQLETGIDFYLIREPQSNPKVELETKLELLWRSELAHIQQLSGIPKYRGKNKNFIRKKILEKIPKSIIQKLISDELFERDYTQSWI